MAKDIFPQWLNLTFVTLNSTTIVVAETNTPKMGENQVLEILKVQYDIDMPSLSSAAAVSNDEDNELLIAITQGSNPGTDTLVRLNEQRCIDFFHKKESSQFAEATETGGGPFVSKFVYIHDFTDGSGKGFLVASEKIYMQAQGSNATMIDIQRARILHRIVTVSASELISLSRQ